MKFSTVVFALAATLSLAPTPAFSQADSDPRSANQLTQDSSSSEDEQEFSASDGSLLTGIFEGARNKVGFAFSAHSTYTPDRVLTSIGTGASLFNNFDGTMYANFRQRRGALSLSYSFGYRMSNGGSQNAPVHSGRARYSYRLGRSSSLEASNTTSSTQNDYAYGVPNVFAYQGQGLPVHQLEIFLDRQRITRNLANVVVNFQPTRNSQIQVSGSHTALWYEKTTGEIQGFQAGIDGGYRISRWLQLGTGYTAYFNPGSSRQGDSLIHRAQFASFGFDLARNLRIQTSGGLEYTHDGGSGLATTGVDLGWSRSGDSNELSVNYHRGFSKALGPGILLEGNDVRVAFDQRITDRIQFNAGAYSIDGSSRFGASLTNVSAGAGLEFLLVENLVARVNSGYAYQKASGVFPNAVNLSRYTVTGGITYVIPLARGR